MNELKYEAQVTVLKSKIHRAVVTDSNLSYMGSITIDPVLLRATNLFQYEKVQVVNINNGQRFETYVITGTEGQGDICLNGACARLGEVGDRVIVMAYHSLPPAALENYAPIEVLLNRHNVIV